MSHSLPTKEVRFWFVLAAKVFLLVLPTALVSPVWSGAIYQCQAAVNNVWSRQQTQCWDIVGRNSTLVTSGQCYLSGKAACDASQSLVLLESRIWVTCVCHAMLAVHDALQILYGVNDTNVECSASFHSWQLRSWSPGALVLGWWTPKRMPNLPKS